MGRAAQESTDQVVEIPPHYLRGNLDDLARAIPLALGIMEEERRTQFEDALDQVMRHYGPQWEREREEERLRADARLQQGKAWMDGPVEIVDTEYWLNHWDELIAALEVAAELPEHEAAISPWWASRVMVESPQWALDHLGELRAGLEEASHLLGHEPELPSVEEFLAREPSEDRHRDGEGHER